MAPVDLLANAVAVSVRALVPLPFPVALRGVGFLTSKLRVRNGLLCFFFVFQMSFCDSLLLLRCLFVAFSYYCEVFCDTLIIEMSFATLFYY